MYTQHFENSDNQWKISNSYAVKSIVISFEDENIFEQKFEVIATSVFGAVW